MQLVLDPYWLGPPANGAAADWLKRIQPVRELIFSGAIKVSCPKGVRDQILAQWFQEHAYSDLIRSVNEIEGRLASSVDLDGGETIFDHASSTPQYSWEGVDDHGHGLFTDHLAEAALAKEDGQTHFGVLSPAQSWSNACDSVLVEAEILQRETLEGELAEPDADDGVLRGFLGRSESIQAFYGVCSQDACALTKEPEFGVEAYFVGVLGGNADALNFEVGPAFRASVSRLGIDRVASNARTLLRTMALIASGKAEQVEGHEERVESAPGSDKVCYRGDQVVRSYVNNHTPNAMRLFWVRKERPIFLNVTGHEGSPDLSGA